MNQPPPLPADEDASAVARAAKDRRRPGRPTEVSPELLPLLRRDSLLATPAAPPHDDLSPARGVALSVLAGAVLWAGVGFAAYWLLLR